MTASLLVFLASSRSITHLFHRAFTVQYFRHRNLVVAVGGYGVGWWLLHQLLQPLDAQADHVFSFAVFWHRLLLNIALLVRGGQILHHVDDGVGIVYLVV